MRRTRFFLFLIILILPLGLLAQEPAKWSLSLEPSSDYLAGDKSKAQLKAEIEPGWHLYALEQAAGGPIATTIKVTEG